MYLERWCWKWQWWCNGDSHGDGEVDGEVDGDDGSDDDDDSGDDILMLVLIMNTSNTESGMAINILRIISLTIHSDIHTRR